MSSDPFHFGPPPNAQQPLSGGPPGGQANPFGAGAAGPAGPTGQPGQGALVAATPPAWLLFVAGGLAIAAGVIALVFDQPVVAIICWLVAGPIAIGLVALFVKRDTFARSSGLYAARDWVKPLHYVVIGVCLLCILAPALRIADWVGRL